MGAFGSGKTTLLNVLSTIDTPTSGDIWINGVNLRKMGGTSAADFRKDNLGFIFQEYFLLDSLTIQENISIPLPINILLVDDHTLFAASLSIALEEYKEVEHLYSTQDIRNLNTLVSEKI